MDFDRRETGPAGAARQRGERRMVSREVRNQARTDDRGATKERRLMPIIVFAAVVALVIIGARSVESIARIAPAQSSANADVGVSLTLDEFLVNLRGGDHYLRTTIALGLHKGKTEEDTKDHIAPIRDAILTVLSAKTLNDLSTPQGKEDLKAELKTKINEAAGTDLVARVYLTAFATQ